MSRGSKSGPNAPADSEVSLAGILPMLLMLLMLLSNRKVSPFENEAFITEIKYDGYWLLAEFEPGRTEIKTRGGADTTRWFPAVVKALAGMNRGRNIVDVEVCVLDEHDRSDFDLLHERALRRRWVAGSVPAAYCIFDVLVLDGRPVMHLPLIERKELLRGLLTPKPDGLLFVDYFVGHAPWLYARPAAFLGGRPGRAVEQPKL